jgi:hypothetical protein
VNPNAGVRLYGQQDEMFESKLMGCTPSKVQAVTHLKATQRRMFPRHLGPRPATFVSLTSVCLQSLDHELSSRRRVWTCHWDFHSVWKVSAVAPSREGRSGYSTLS